jgi:AraC-like DNA-binding protein
MADEARWTHFTDGQHSLDLLTARYHRHAFTPHSHATFAIGVVLAGREQIQYRGAAHTAGVGSLAILEPDERHDGRPADPAGWAYRVFYPTEAMLLEGFDGRPRFAEPIVDDPATTRLVLAAHEAVTGGADPLAAQTLLTTALHTIVRRHGRIAVAAAPRPGDSAALKAVSTIRDRLLADLRCAPGLRELAAGVELSPYHMLRIFKDVTGFPPHTWLVLERICRARHLLAAGARPAHVSSAVGFADQAHLTRWFKRVTGVTPAAYRKSVQDPVRTGVSTYPA